MPKEGYSVKKIRFRSFFVLLFVVALAFTACVATVRNLQPGVDFPATLSVFNYMSRPVLVELERRLVDNYQVPSEYNGQTTSLGGFGAYGTYTMMYDVRHAVYDNNGGYKKLDVVLPALLESVKVVSAYPNAVSWFYYANAQIIVDDMVTYARQPLTEEYRARPGYTDTEISEMFTLYAREIERVVPYLLVALEKPVSDQVKSTMIDIYRPLPHNASYKEWSLNQERIVAAENELRASLSASYGVEFDVAGYESWKFGLRRMKDGGPEFLTMVIKIAEDAALRARAKATELLRDK